MTRAPARTMAATPCRQASESRRYSGPTVTVPSAPMPSPPSPSRSEAGMAASTESTPNVSQAPGSTACRHRAIPDLPELDPPLSTIT